jgi:hypothetical protein
VSEGGNADILLPNEDAIEDIPVLRRAIVQRGKCAGIGLLTMVFGETVGDAKT